MPTSRRTASASTSDVSSPPVFSRRIPPQLEPNALARAVDALRESAAPVADLTESNPTRAGIPYPDGLLAPLAGAAALRPLAFATLALGRRRFMDARPICFRCVSLSQLA